MSDVANHTLATLLSHPEQDELKMHPKELTLIVAATSKNMGIGKNGRLPWTGLKKEMAYFARVTKRADEQNIGGNVVIMGRKTWESIPPKFRPLKDRINVVVSRSNEKTSVSVNDAVPGLVNVGSIKVAADQLGQASLRKSFIIGGAEIYKAALELEETKRILLTRILDDFDCDTFFPLNLGADGVSEGWRRKDLEQLRSWTGEKDLSGTVQEENGTKYVFEMWEKIDAQGI